MSRLLGPLFLTLAAVSPLAAQEPRIEPVLVELQLGRLVSRTVPAHRSGDVALIPLRQFFEMAELRTRTEGDGELVAILQPGNRRLVVHPARRRLEVDGASRSLASNELVVQDGEVFLSTAVLGPILGLRFQTAWEDLEVTAVDPDMLPVARRLRREEANRTLRGGGPLRELTESSAKPPGLSKDWFSTTVCWSRPIPAPAGERTASVQGSTFLVEDLKPGCRTKALSRTGRSGSTSPGLVSGGTTGGCPS